MPRGAILLYFRFLFLRFTHRSVSLSTREIDQQNADIRRINSADTRCLADIHRTDLIELFSCLKSETEDILVGYIRRQKLILEPSLLLNLGELSLDISLILYLYSNGSSHRSRKLGTAGIDFCQSFVAKLGASQKICELYARRYLG